MESGRVARKAEMEGWRKEHLQRRRKTLTEKEEGERDGSTQQRTTGDKSHNESNQRSTVCSFAPSAPKKYLLPINLDTDFLIFVH